MKDNFDSPRISIVRKILNRFISFPFLNIYTEIDNDKDFISAVTDLTDIDIIVRKNEISNDFPQFTSTSIHAKFQDLTVKSISLEYEKYIDKGISNIKAKGEFLERLSVMLPIDTFSKSFDFKKNIDSLVNRKILFKNAFNFGYKKIDIKYVYYGLRHSSILSTDYLWQATTNGCAGHFSKEKALTSAILELIQRDSFLAYWLNTISPKIIDIKFFKENNKDLKIDSPAYSFLKILEDLEKYNIEYYFLDITSDIEVPAVCCVLVSDTGKGEKKMSVGASCGFGGVKELISACLEGLSTLPYVFNNYDNINFQKENYIPFKDSKIDKDQRLLIYQKSEMYKEFEFFIANKSTTSLEEWSTVDGYILEKSFDVTRIEHDTSHQLKYLKEIFKKRSIINPDYNLYFYNIKNKILSNFEYYAVRVVCFGLHQLYLNENHANPTHPRVKEFVKNKGLEREAKLNIWPHPFP